MIAGISEKIIDIWKQFWFNHRLQIDGLDCSYKLFDSQIMFTFVRRNNIFQTQQMSITLREKYIHLAKVCVEQI